MTIQEMKNLNFVIPFFFKGAPRQSVMLQGELRCVKNETYKHFGKVSIYTNSHFEPLNTSDYLSLEDAKKLVEENGGIWVKEGFDTLSVEDLREIKTQLSEEWINGFNEWIGFND